MEEIRIVREEVAFWLQELVSQQARELEALIGLVDHPAD